MKFIQKVRPGGRYVDNAGGWRLALPVLAMPNMKRYDFDEGEFKTGIWAFWIAIGLESLNGGSKPHGVSIRITWDWQPTRFVTSPLTELRAELRKAAN